MPGTSSSGGRNKKSTREHELAGTYRKDRHAGAAAEPDPPKGRPSCPRELTGAARAEWTRMAHRLELSKTLSTVDDAALYQYCCLFAETEAIASAARRNAELVERLAIAIARATKRELGDIESALERILALKKLEVKYTQQLRQGHMALRQYLVEFGMTPAARTRVKVSASSPASEPTDPFAEFDEPQGLH